jgi:S-formylglutathione hydrolase FrmB
VKGSILRGKIESAVLIGNPLADSATKDLIVYLPPGYDFSGGRHFPTVYFLHGFMGSAEGWLNRSPFSLTVPERVDALIVEGKLPPAICVFPDGLTGMGGTQWNNSPALGRYQDFVADEVVSHVDARFRTVPKAHGRAVVGKSSGGYGAMLMGATRSEVFSHVGSIAGDAYFEYCYQPDFPKAASAFLRAGGPEAWFRDFVQRAHATKARGDDHPVLNTLAMAAAYSPNAERPLGLELPFDPETARPLPEVFSRWKEQDPVELARTHRDAFRKLTSIALECGTRDEFNLRWGTRMVVAALRAHGVNVSHQEFEDGHFSTNYRYDTLLGHLLPRMEGANG